MRQVTAGKVAGGISASLFSRFSPLETGWLAQLLIPGMRRSFSKTGADPGDQLLGPRDQLLFLVRGSAPEIRAPPFPIGPPRLPTAPACCPAQGPASAGKPHVKSARREREFAPLCDRVYCPAEPLGYNCRLYWINDHYDRLEQGQLLCESRTSRIRSCLRFAALACFLLKKQLISRPWHLKTDRQGVKITSSASLLRRAGRRSAE